MFGRRKGREKEKGDRRSASVLYHHRHWPVTRRNGLGDGAGQFFQSMVGLASPGRSIIIFDWSGTTKACILIGRQVLTASFFFLPFSFLFFFFFLFFTYGFS